MTHHIKAYLALIGQISIVGLSFLFVKEGLRYTDPFTQLSHRFIIASIGMLVVSMATKQQSTVTVKKMKDLFLLGIFYPVLFFSLQTLSLQDISTLDAGIINALNPIILLVLAIFLLRERPSSQQKMVMVLSFVGILAINLSGQQGNATFNLFGMVLMFLSVLSSGMYTITARKIAESYSTIEMTKFMLLFGAIVFTVIAFGQRLFGQVTTSYIEPLVIPNYLITILYLGLLSSLLTSALSNYALHHVKASVVALFSNLTPIIVILSGVLILKEPIKMYQVVGISLIIMPILSLALLNQFHKKTRSSES
ncbi:hypothetical protein CBF34_04750 [Vagococcus penaei]|uniref:EamA domain-containing protein n=1 Tax=Vagococcus penaei TaxID=633807 RepID=A0A1Q2D4L4_9ENTE|nr:DMT family transporter [Vagococcus penaei]AQP53332.1 hypothetical protein BW732_03175 [Vagococcus penaei]RSU04103.1 hypothetical protein CBF34_04750 [Vagococcus penaei]